jgi:hypothetical protein
MSAIERLTAASKAPGKHPDIGKWHVIDPADLRAILTEFATLQQRVADAEAERDAVHIGLNDKVARAIADKQREIAGEPPMTDDHWYRLNPWEAEALALLADAAIRACFTEVQN